MATENLGMTKQQFIQKVCQAIGTSDIRRLNKSIREGHGRYTTSSILRQMTTIFTKQFEKLGITHLQGVWFEGTFIYGLGWVIESGRLAGEPVLAIWQYEVRLLVGLLYDIYRNCEYSSDVARYIYTLNLKRK